MQYKIAFLALCISTSIVAKEMDHHTITSCAYQGGTAREIQTIRQTEGHDWTEFEQQIDKIYKQDQAKNDLLEIAKTVYQQALTATLDEVYDNAVTLCIKRTEAAAKLN